MSSKDIHPFLTYLIATVWLVNGLFCKVFNLVPRHEQIVASILNEDFARALTVLIGLSEIVMAIWVVSIWKSRLSAGVQMTLVAVMNLLEFLLVPDLLLWGRLNSVFALQFILLIYFNEFRLGNKLEPRS